MSLTVNVIGYTVTDRLTLEGLYRSNAPGPYSLVMDDIQLAIRLNNMLPQGKNVVFRRYRPDDHKLHETISPEDFLRSTSDVPYSMPRQVFNEPGDNSDAFQGWCVTVMALAAARGITLCLPNWSMGNPSEVDLKNGVWDRLLRAFARYPQHILGVHEYFNNHPLTEPWHVGRYRNILARFDTLRIKRPKVFVSEFGRDIGGGHDGWRTAFSDEEYARLLKLADEQVYGPAGISAAVFCWGRGFGDRWQTYNIEGSTPVITSIRSTNFSAPAKFRVTTVAPGVRVNIRQWQSTTAPKLGYVVTGDEITKTGNPVFMNGYTWQPCFVQKIAAKGYIALEVVRLTSV